MGWRETWPDKAVMLAALAVSLYAAGVGIVW